MCLFQFCRKVPDARGILLVLRPVEKLHCGFQSPPWCWEDSFGQLWGPPCYSDWKDTTLRMCFTHDPWAVTVFIVLLITTKDCARLRFFSSSCRHWKSHLAQAFGRNLRKQSFLTRTTHVQRKNLLTVFPCTKHHQCALAMFVLTKKGITIFYFVSLVENALFSRHL